MKLNGVCKFAIGFAMVAALVLGASGAQAQNLIATGVSDNTNAYTLTGGVFYGVGVSSDGSTSTNRAHGVASTAPSTYTITYTFAPDPKLAMSAVQVWANAGSNYADGELRSFDLAIDYHDTNGNLQTLTMSNINIGDTLSESDVKTVTLVDGSGNPVYLFDVSEVRMSNLGDGGTGSIVLREFQGVFVEGIDLVTQKSIAYGNPTPNETELVAFDITVTNNGPATAENVSLTDTLPAGITEFTGNGTASTGTYDAVTGVWSIPSLAPGASATLRLIGSVNAGTAGTTIVNTTTGADNIFNDETNTIGDQLSASLAVNTPSAVTQTSTVGIQVNAACHPNLAYISDGDSYKDHAYCIDEPIDPAYQLEIDQTPAPSDYLESISIWANGGNSYIDAELRSFDLYIDYVDESGNPQTYVLTGVNIGDTASSTDEKVVQLVDGSGNPISLPNVQTIRLGALSSGGTGQVVLREVQANYVPADIDLVTVKTLTSNPVLPSVGDTATFEVVITNNGSNIAQNVVLTDLLPAGLTATANNGTVTAGTYDAGTGLWSIATLGANGGTATLTIEGTIDAGTQGTTIANTTTAANADFNDTANTTGDLLTQQFAVSNPELSVVKVANKTTNVAAGETVTYTYTVTNTGNVSITNVSLQDVHNGSDPAPVPNNEFLAGDAAPAGDSTDASVDKVWDVLAPGDSVTFTGTYTVTQTDVDTLQ